MPALLVGALLLLTSGATWFRLLCQEWTYDVPAEVAPLDKEFDPTRFWDIICHLIRESIEGIWLIVKHLREDRLATVGEERENTP